MLTDRLGHGEQGGSQLFGFHNAGADPFDLLILAILDLVGFCLQPFDGIDDGRSKEARQGQQYQNAQGGNAGGQKGIVTGRTGDQ